MNSTDTRRLGLVVRRLCELATHWHDAQATVGSRPPNNNRQTNRPPNVKLPTHATHLITLSLQLAWDDEVRGWLAFGACLGLGLVVEGLYHKQEAARLDIDVGTRDEGGLNRPEKLKAIFLRECVNALSTTCLSLVISHHLTIFDALREARCRPLYPDVCVCCRCSWPGGVSAVGVASTAPSRIHPRNSSALELTEEKVWTARVFGPSLSGAA